MLFLLHFQSSRLFHFNFIRFFLHLFDSRLEPLFKIVETTAFAPFVANVLTTYVTTCFIPITSVVGTRAASTTVTPTRRAGRYAKQKTGQKQNAQQTQDKGDCNDACFSLKRKFMPRCIVQDIHVSFFF